MDDKRIRDGKVVYWVIPRFDRRAKAPIDLGRVHDP